MENIFGTKNALAAELENCRKKLLEKENSEKEWLIYYAKLCVEF